MQKCTEAFPMFFFYKI